MKVHGKPHHFWRAVDHEGEMPVRFVTKTRDRKAALKFLKKAMHKHGLLETVVTDKLRFYGAPLEAPGCGDAAVERAA
ncbi:DDE-type integrase/transposase/recombinase [Silicimonas sp. MF1-12-2]|uniref:DDE-type integrase/transposase/recombinase n=1 Tax=Silicimonas sp. MF1-12-2 TaxID=3384793 RepID=UPI0039B6A2F1